jgi:hypothetical protein
VALLGSIRRDLDGDDRWVCRGKDGAARHQREPPAVDDHDDVVVVLVK